MMPANERPVGPALPTGWRVVSQIRKTRLTGPGQTAGGWTVHFTTTSGFTSSVWVPDATYTPERVQALIRPLVANINAVGALNE